jgi:hypothetical protein
MKARVGDYIRFDPQDQDGVKLYSISRVVGISDCLDGSEEYDTESGHTINENDLTIDDVLLESEV